MPSSPPRFPNLSRDIFVLCGADDIFFAARRRPRDASSMGAQRAGGRVRRAADDQARGAGACYGDYGDA